MTEAEQQRGFIEWFWRGRSLRKARQFRSELPAAEQLSLARALRAAELGDRAFDPVEPLRSGSSLALSVSLYREAAYWALLAHGAPWGNLAAAFAGAPPALLELAAGGSDGLAEVRGALVERSFVETAELPEQLLPRDAQVAQAFVHGLLRLKLQPEARVGRLLVQRGVRTYGGALFLLLLAVGGFLLVQRSTLAPDLAAGKPWRASSGTEVCRPAEHRCAGVKSDMFFTTNEEKEPWVEIDLGKTMPFNRVDVVNRDDCCPDRAVPLVIEVSRDGKQFREVMRRNDTFSRWTAKFAPQKARYVRLRVLRRSILHLNQVAVRNG